MTIQFKYLLILLSIFIGDINLFAQSILCETNQATSTNTLYLRFAESALVIDNIPYLEDDVTLHALYKSPVGGMVCGGKFRFDKGESVTMALSGKDVFLMEGIGEGDGIFLVLQKDDGCILDSLSIQVKGETEKQDSLIFQANRLIDINIIEAQTGDCLLTSTPEIPPFNALKIYPNPTSGHVQVELNLHDFSQLNYSIVNPLGEEVHRGLLKGQSIQATIDLSGFPLGIYYLRLNQDSFGASRKIVLVE